MSGVPRFSPRAFTLVELVVSMAVLMLLIILINQTFGAALTVTGSRNKQMDADAQARGIFDRMAIDFSQMVKRPDVDYFLKSSAADQYSKTNPQTGGGSGVNDQIAFYSRVPGYCWASGTESSSVSLVGWRVNSNTASAYYDQLQRYGYGLLWNGFSTSGSSAIAFTTGTNGASCCGSGSNAISSRWPNATNMVDDPNYEPMGPQVFRMEYNYVLKGQTVSGIFYASELSDTPWDFRIPGHNSVSGMKDVAAITMLIAVADPKSRTLVKNSQLVALAGQMADFPATGNDGTNTTQPGWLQAKWQTAINDPANGIPRIAMGALRVYQRTFYMPSYQPNQ